MSKKDLSQILTPIKEEDSELTAGVPGQPKLVEGVILSPIIGKGDEEGK